MFFSKNYEKKEHFIKKNQGINTNFVKTSQKECKFHERITVKMRISLKDREKHQFCRRSTKKVSQILSKD